MHASTSRPQESETGQTGDQAVKARQSARCHQYLHAFVRKACRRELPLNSEELRLVASVDFNMVIIPASNRDHVAQQGWVQTRTPLEIIGPWPKGTESCRSLHQQAS